MATDKIELRISGTSPKEVANAILTMAKIWQQAHPGQDWTFTTDETTEGLCVAFHASAPGDRFGNALNRNQYLSRNQFLDQRVAS
jgi:hypothetical protein